LQRLVVLKSSCHTMAPQRYLWPGDLDDIEDIQNYRPGGFHPVHIGDVIRDEYRILHKLGCGGFSTVWLARALTDQRLCALKILAANAPSDELDIMLYLAETVGSHPNVSSLHNHFTIMGPNGPHRCLVLSVLGPSLKHIQKLKLPTTAARGAARQIAHGLS
jgi:serine/threonine-protein kinase SRPK3